MNKLLYTTCIKGVEHAEGGLRSYTLTTSFYSDGSSSEEKVYGELVSFNCITDWC